MSIRDIKAAAAELAAHEAGADSLLCEDCGEHRALAAPHACNTTGEHSLGRYTRAGGAGGVGSGEPTPVVSLDLAAMHAPTDSESLDALYNPDVWELRQRVDALVAAVERVVTLCKDPGGSDSWTHTFNGHPSVFADDVLQALGVDHV